MKKSKVTHDSTKIAKKRNKIANRITDDEVHLETVYNALKVPNANLIEKLTLALTSFPEARLDFSHAKNRFNNILDLLVAKEQVASEDVSSFKHFIKNIDSLKDLLAMNVVPLSN